jgi:DNA-binding response OmpR family regulator
MADPTMKILLIDDDPDAVALRRLIFEAQGYHVSTATDAPTARALFGQNPDVVVTDLRLPDAADGLALIRDFRAASPGVRIVVLCGWPADLDGRPERAMIDVLLAKPVRSQALLSKILPEGV